MTINTSSIFAQALADNRDYKKERINGKLVGISEYRKWSTAMTALRLKAYAVAVYRHDNMGKAETVEPMDMSAFFESLNVVLDLVGVVNGAKLSAHNCAETIIAQASRIRTIDISNEMASARCDKREAAKALKEEETEENQKAYDDACALVKDLESKPGNCRNLFEIQTENAFIKNVEVALGDAIIGQAMKSAEQVAAEEEAKRQARRAKAAAKKKAKKSAK